MGGGGGRGGLPKRRSTTYIALNQQSTFAILTQIYNIRSKMTKSTVPNLQSKAQSSYNLQPKFGPNLQSTKKVHPPHNLECFPLEVITISI